MIKITENLIDLARNAEKRLKFKFPYSVDEWVNNKNLLMEILQSFNRRNRMILENHNIYYIVTNTYTFYLAAVRKDSKYCENENLVFELMKNIII